MCSFALGPFTLNTINNVTIENKPVLTVKDTVPGSNIVFAGVMCTSMSNPTVASATAAAFGVLTPQPCTPMPAGMWIPGTMNSKVKQMAILDSSCSLMCAYGGKISVIFPGSLKTQVK